MPAFIFALILVLSVVLGEPRANAGGADQMFQALAATNTTKCERGAHGRVEAIKKLMDQGRSLRPDHEMTMLRDVTRFFYRNISVMDDRQVWGWADYWASPMETLCAGAGDSEDFAIAKYYTLLAMGVPESQMRIVYAQSTWVGPVMVLLYTTTHGQRIVLYNDRMWTLNTVMSRHLLQPVYAFDEDAFWLANAGWTFARLDGAKKIEQWNRVLHDMSSGGEG
ncbi:MAG: transglutaminase-like cysteine peptidase [Arenicellales bacterium]